LFPTLVGNAQNKLLLNNFFCIIPFFKGVIIYKHIIKTIIILSTTFIFALAEKHHEEHHADWELGLSAGYANLKTEGEEGSNLHLHLMKSLGDEGLQQYFSVGLGLETIITDEEHYGAMLTLAFHPIEDLTFAFSPGFEWAKHDGKNWEREYATHLEMTYAFDVLENLHVGPVVGYSKTKEGEHHTIGLHFGLPL
jgi:hypothetical protein